MSVVFLTGASGFLGRRVRAALLRKSHAVVALQRGADPTPGNLRGDLLDPASYEPELEKADVVLHLAAATGRASPATLQRVNVQGTEALLTAARKNRPRFIFVSSIAARGNPGPRQHYARSKQAAEALVQTSGLPWTIVRPTIVAGPGSPVMTGLARLAALPLVPTFGGAPARVQPIHVDDLAELLAELVDQEPGPGQTLEFGGPEVVTLRDLLVRLGTRQRGGAPRLLDIPIGAVAPLLALGETLAPGRMPLTVGQLENFRVDGTASPNPLQAERAGRMIGLTEMVESSLS